MNAGPIVNTTELGAYLAGSPQSAIDAATGAVRAYCGWHVTPEVTESVTLDVASGLVLLPSLHVTAVSSVVADGDTLDPDRYEWSAAGILRASLRRGFRKVEVTMTHGYVDAPEIAGVILAMAARSVVSPDGVMRAQVGQISETYSQTANNQAGGIALLLSEMSILDRYKLPPRP